jgi:endoglucanase
VANTKIIKFSLTSILLSMAYLTSAAANMTISGTPSETVTVGETYRFMPVVTNANASGLQFNYINKPSWAKGYRGSGLITGRPTTPGIYANIQIGAWDGSHYAVLPPFTITVKGVSTTPPPGASLQISGTPSTTAVVGKFYSFTPTINASAISTLQYAIANKPSWATFNALTGSLSGTPSTDTPVAFDGIVIGVSNGTSQAALPAFNIGVTKAAGTGTTPAGSPQSVAMSATSYAVAQSAGKVAVTVNRSGGTTGAVSVNYATSNGTAAAGQNYTAQSGALSWSAGDASAKTIVVPISSTVISNPVTFKVALASPSGAALGTPAATTVTVNKNSSFGISVSGNRLVDAQGSTVQLRGVNVSGLESVAVFGWSPQNPWGAQTGTATPDWNLIKSWGSNVVRLPLNEASWLGLSCVDVGGVGQTVTNGVKTQNTPGATIKADPGGNYQSTVINSVAGAAAAGLYVILDLHLAAPGNDCPTMQNAMADADHSIAFWTSVASTFKSSPSVIFELFNEPFLDMTSALVDTSPLLDLLNGGGTLSSYVAQTPNNPWHTTVSHTWKSAGMQQMLNAVRATGATNVVLTSSVSYAGAIFDWLQYKPTDPANQLGAVWHAYSVPAYPHQVDCVNMPGCSATVMAAAQAIKAAGYPVVITEYGDTIGGSTAPWASVLLPFADANDISYLGWTWDTWQGQTANDLITDAAGDPSQGFGTYVKAHYQCRAAGNAVCQ